MRVVLAALVLLLSACQLHVEIDYVETGGPPTQETMDTVVKAYAYAGVEFTYTLEAVPELEDKDMDWDTYWWYRDNYRDSKGHYMVFMRRDSWHHGEAYLNSHWSWVQVPSRHTNHRSEADTIMHELGHNFGFGHTEEGVMRIGPSYLSYSLDQWFVIWSMLLNAASNDT